MKKFFPISFIFIYFYEINAYAYLDPGTGSIILQALVGAIAAVSSYFYFYKKKVKDFFKKFKKNKKEHQKEDSDKL